MPHPTWYIYGLSRSLNELTYFEILSSIFFDYFWKNFAKIHNWFVVLSRYFILLPLYHLFSTLFREYYPSFIATKTCIPRISVKWVLMYTCSWSLRSYQKPSIGRSFIVSCMLKIIIFKVFRNGVAHQHGFSFFIVL